MRVVSIGRTFLGVLFFSLPLLRANVTLPSIFGDHMMFQRSVTLPVWGKALPGEKVSVSFGNRYEQTIADSMGRWRIALRSLPKSSEPQNLVINGNNRIEFHDVIVGDVWICAGDGNMSFPLVKTPEWVAQHGVTNEVQIRFYLRGASISRSREEVGHWVVCTRDQASASSAVGYFFARDLWSSQHIPIGMIQCTRTDSPTSSWISGTKKAPPQFTRVEHNNHSVFNELIAPIVPFSIAGVIWYKGECDQGLSVLRHRGELTRLIKDWRKLWAEGPFPFYAVTPAGYGNKGEDAVDLYLRQQGATTGCLPWLREAIATILTLPATGVAVADDLGIPDEQFNPEKLLVGRRLALLARHRFYGEEISDAGPVCKDVRIEGNKVRVIFETYGCDLTLGVPPSLAAGENSSLATSLRGFALRGSGLKWVPAQGRIEGKSVVLSCATVPSPKFVRYNWKDFPEGNLYSDDAIPAASFRSDMDQPNTTASRNK
jgi:sialate O-acetylesterase